MLSVLGKSQDQNCRTLSSGAVALGAYAASRAVFCICTPPLKILLRLLHFITDFGRLENFKIEKIIIKEFKKCYVQGI